MKPIRTIAATAAVLATGLALAACGSDNATGPTDAQVQDAAGTATTRATTQETTTEARETTTETQETTTETVADDGKEVFTTNCAGCHTLAAADASGEVGPNLDETKPSASVTEAKVKGGGGGMPGFEGQLSPEEIQAVSAYVADNAGS